MHTVLLSKQISPSAYSNILSGTPHEVIKDDDNFMKFKIINHLLTTLEQSERESLPQMYLFRYEKDRKQVLAEEREGNLEEDVENGLEYGDKLVFYMFEIEINFYECLFGKDGYKSIPAGSMAVMTVNSILALVDKAVPELKKEDKTMVPLRWLYPSQNKISCNAEIPLWPELEKLYKKIHPGQSIPGRAGILRALSLSDNKEIKEIMRNLFQEPEIFACPDLEDYIIMLIFYCKYPTSYKLKRIDYNLDIFTEYKEILLKLASMGYGLNRMDNKDEKKKKDDPCEVYKNEATGKIESYYIKLPSYHINIYDKYADLVDKNKQDCVEENARYLLRFEVQLMRSRLNYEVNRNVQGIEGMKRELEYFLTYELELQIMKYFLERILGNGNYYTFTSAVEIVENSDQTKNMKKKLCRVLKHVAKRGSIRSFLECVENGKITDCGVLDTAKKYLKMLHEMNVNPVTISRNMQKRMESIQRKVDMELLPCMLRYPEYHYRSDFLYNPLVYLEINYQIFKTNQKMGYEAAFSYLPNMRFIPDSEKDKKADS